MIETAELPPITPSEAAALHSEIFCLLHPEYREQPVDLRTFVTSTDYLGLKNDVYRSLLEAGMDVTTRGIREIVVLAGIGSGKSFLSQVLCLYVLHTLLCLKDPHAYYGMAKDKPISIINMGTSAAQAKRVVFRGITYMFNNCKWFRQFEAHVLASSISVDHNKIELVCGNSKEETPLGMNVICAVLDEAAFYLDNEEKSAAEAIYHALASRITSRFGRNGLIIVISSPRFDGDFISKKYKESLLFPDRVIGIKMPTWKAKNRELMSKTVFVFDSKTMRIVPPEQYQHYETPEGTANLTLDEDVAVKLEYGVAELDRRFWVIPVDYEDDFVRNPEKSARDLGAEAQRSIDQFIKLSHTIQMAVGRRANIVQDDGTWILPKEKPQNPLFIHIDLGLNRKGKGDACGFAAGHLIGHDPDHEGMARVQIDIVEQILAGETGEVIIENVRARIKNLADQGWDIALVTMDGWQSADSIQIINSWGISAEELSVDRTTKPYDSLKNSLYCANVVLPSKNTHVEVALRELAELEIVKDKKIDHPPKGSKDVSDAIAGVVYSINQYYGANPDA